MSKKRPNGMVMRGIKHELDCHDRPIEIVVLADLHIGDPNSNSELIQELINGVRDNENRYAILAGDLMNTAIVNSKSDSYGETLRPSEQLERCYELLSPIKDKILCIVPGNHEERITRTAGTDMTRLLARELGLQHLYSDTTALLFLRFGRNQYRYRPFTYSLYVSHGSGGGGKRAGSKINSLEDLANVISVDCYICGHTHLPATFKRMHYMADLNNSCATAHEQLFVNTASALSYGGYGRRGGYAPGSNSYPIITLDNRQHHMTATV